MMPELFFNIFMNYIKLNIVLNNSNIYLLIKYFR